MSELVQTNLVRVELPSAAGVDTPEILKSMIAHYKVAKELFDGEVKRKTMIRVFVDGYGLTEQCVIDLLSEKIPHTVEGNSVFFDYTEGEYLAEK